MKKTCIQRFSSTLALVAPSVVMVASQADGAAYIKFDGVDGESKSVDHKGWIELESFSWGVSPAAAVAGGSGGGKVSIQDFTIHKRVDKASPALFLACATGQTIPTVTLVVTRTVGDREVPYYKIILHDVTIGRIAAESGRSADGRPEPELRPVQTVQLKYYPKIEFIYTPVDEATGAAGEPVSSGVIETAVVADS